MFSFTPGTFFNHSVDYSNRGQVPSILGETDPVQHSQLRKPWNRSFNGPSLKDYEQVVTEKARELVHELDKRRAVPVDISMWMDLFAYVPLWLSLLALSLNLNLKV
jgi:cytochrome P450